MSADHGARAGVFILLSGVLLALLLTVGCCVGLWTLRRDELAAAGEDLRRLSLALSEQTSRAFQEIDTIIRETRPILTPEELAAAATGDALHRQLRNRFIGLPQGQALLVFGADGRMLAHSRVYPTPKVLVIDREYFRAQIDGGHDELFVSAPLRNRINNNWMISLSRRLSGPHGEFLGVIMAAVEMDYFLRLYRSLELPPGALIELQRADGTLLATYPFDDTRLGTIQPPCTAVPHAISAASAVGALPMSVCLAVPRDIVLQRWRWLAWTIGLATLVAVTGIGVLTGVLMIRVRQLRLHTLAAQRSTAELEQVAYIASHDLQTPLRNIASFTQLLALRYRGRLDSDAEEFMDFIVDGTKQVSTMISDLADFARVSEADPSVAPVPAQRALDRALVHLGPLVRESGGAVLAGELPTVLADEDQFASLLENLLENALLYRHPGRAPRVTVTAERASPALWRFAVADNGIGIDKDYFEKIFVIFQRLSPGDHPGSTGVGLAVCRRIVHRLGGEIWLDSTPGEGSTFYFTVPAGHHAAYDSAPLRALRRWRRRAGERIAAFSGSVR